MHKNLFIHSFELNFQVDQTFFQWKTNFIYQKND